jgi:REP element-mobilizing transposase RayT
MGRPLRIQYPDALYHVMNRGLEHRPTFLNEPDHERFIGLLNDIAERWQVRIYAYCCMSTHYHLLIQTPHGNLARVMRHLGGLYTQRFNRARTREGPLFRGRYRALLVEAETYLLRVVRYIHLNPVEVGLVDDPGAYPWASHRLYRTSLAPAWLARGVVLASFDDLPAFERFVAEGNERSLEAFYAQPRRSPILGSPDFIRTALARARLSLEHVRRETTPQFATVDDVVRALSQRLALPPEHLLGSRRGQRNIPRALAMHIASRSAGFSHPAICRVFGLRRPSAVSAACQRAGRARPGSYPPGGRRRLPPGPHARKLNCTCCHFVQADAHSGTTCLN